MALDYTYDELCSMLDDDAPPPAPLTRKQMREAIQRADRERADADALLMRLREEEKEVEFQTAIMKMRRAVEDARGTIQVHEEIIIALRWEVVKRLHRAIASRASVPRACSAESVLTQTRFCGTI